MSLWPKCDMLERPQASNHSTGTSACRCRQPQVPVPVTVGGRRGPYLLKMAIFSKKEGLIDTLFTRPQ